MQNLLYSFVSEAGARGARSTALHALQWGMGMVLCSIPLSIFAKAPAWILIVLVVALGLILVTFLGAYLFLLGKNPDALRSEDYSLSKMAIEHGLIGDSKTGLREISIGAVSQTKALITDEGKDK